MVKVYSIPECPWCQKAKSYLKLKGVQFEDINVAVDEKGRDEMIGLTGGHGVPVIKIENNIVVGFDKAKIDEYLKL